MWTKRALLAVALYVVLWMLYYAGSVYWLISHDPGQTSFQALREGEGVATKAYTFVPLEEISPNLRRAVITGEDQRFWEHNGFDVDAIRKAAIKNLTSGEVVRGGSTITQQLAKNLYLGEEKSLLRKAKEAYFTLLLESFLDKERILTLYLNVIEWGEGIYGAEAASQYYFHHPAKSLSKEEAAHLAAMIPNPRTVYNPKVNPERHRKHKKFILKWFDSMSATPPTPK